MEYKTNYYKDINWKEKNDNEIYEYFDNIDNPIEQANFLIDMVRNFPEKEIGYLELMEDTADILIYQHQIELIEKMANTFKEVLPEEYAEEYQFMEKRLIEYYFFQNNIQKILERLEIVKQNPVKGIDTITIRFLYLLIFHGYYKEAYEYSLAVWKPIYDSDEVFGNGHAPFVITIYLFELEKVYECIQNKQEADWNTFREKMIDYDFEEEKEVMDLVIHCIEKPYNKDILYSFIQKKEYRKAHTMINIYFLKYMKDNYEMSFTYSDILFSLFASEDLYKNKRDANDYFLFSFDKLDKHISSRFDSMYQSNLEELFGKVFGLKYIYHFINRIGIINEEGYNLMMDNIRALQYLFICIADSDLWKMTFVHKWPKLFTPDPSGDRMYRLTFEEDVNEIDISVDNYKKLIYHALPENLRKKVNAPDEYPDYGEPIFNLDKNDSLFEPEFSNFTLPEPFIKESPDIRRNDPCPCGSGKKYKKCCLNKA